MTEQLDCGCTFHFTVDRIVFCPMHAAAPDLLAALKALVVSVAPFESKLSAAIGNTSMPAMNKARAAIAKARDQ